MNVVQKRLDELHMPEKNVRRHTDKQLAEYVRSIQMFGQIKPLVVAEDGEILAGNGLYLALKEMGAESCECCVVAGLDAKQRRKLMLADNRVYELGVTDMNVFDEIIRGLEGDIDVPGWDEDLLAMLNSSAADTNEELESYGVYEPAQVETVNSRERVDHAAQPAAPAPVAGAEPPAGTERVIICPKCGERICL